MPCSEGSLALAGAVVLVGALAGAADGWAATAQALARAESAFAPIVGSASRTRRAFPAIRCLAPSAARAWCVPDWAAAFRSPGGAGGAIGAAPQCGAVPHLDVFALGVA